ncbi:uncharacterized protein [Atheta coriaria]|uniref:uncharacterized protein isoform X12 n=1 Tax=Dalotia coriaria TaxID=877792 RepID=UPI0031F3B4BC
MSYNAQGESSWYLPYPCNPMSATLRANAISWGNCSFTKFGRTQCRGATVLSPNLFSGRTQCRKTTVFSPSSGNRIVVGQLFFHQIPANAMSWGNRSCTKLYGALNGSHFYRYFRTVP